MHGADSGMWPRIPPARPRPLRCDARTPLVVHVSITRSSGGARAQSARPATGIVATGKVVMAEMTWQAGELLIALEIISRGNGFRQIAFTASRGGFRASRAAYVDDDDLELFTGAVERLWKSLNGQAELLGDYGTEFTLRLTMLSAGHVKVDVEVNETFAELRLESETDQTFLPALHDGLLALV